MRYFILVDNHSNFDMCLKRYRLSKDNRKDIYINKKDGSLWTILNSFNDNIFLMKIPEITTEELFKLFDCFTYYSNLAGASTLIAEKYGREFLDFLNNKPYASKRFRKNIRIFSEIALPYSCFYYKKNTEMNQSEKEKLVKVWDEINNIVMLFKN